MEESNDIPKCGLCGKSFSNGATLKIHIHTIHEGHKDHKCVPCGKSFSEAGTLKKHTYLHNSRGHQKS